MYENMYIVSFNSSCTQFKTQKIFRPYIFCQCVGSTAVGVKLSQLPPMLYLGAPGEIGGDFHPSDVMEPAPEAFVKSPPFLFDSKIMIGIIEKNDNLPL